MKLNARLAARALLLLCALSIGLHHGLADANDLWQEEEQRFRIGLKLFPACVGALVGLNERASTNGKLLIIVVHDDLGHIARQAADHLSRVGQIRGLPLEVKTLAASRLDDFDLGQAGAIFVASVGIESARLRAWSEATRALVFSPFPGDAEGGAVAGIYVTDRILPLINPVQAKRAGIRFKPFFLKVARIHE